MIPQIHHATSPPEPGAAVCARGSLGAALTPSLCKEWNHLQKQIATFKVLIGSLSNLALIIHTHTREHKNLQSSVPRAKITIFL